MTIWAVHALLKSFNAKSAWKFGQCARRAPSTCIKRKFAWEPAQSAVRILPQRGQLQLSADLRRVQCACLLHVVSCSQSADLRRVLCAGLLHVVSSSKSADRDSKTKHIVFKLATLFFFEYTSRILYCLNKVAKLKEIILQINFTPLY